MAEQVDAPDLKSVEPSSCEFESRHQHQICGYRITANTPSFQVGNEDSTPSTRSNGSDETHPLSISRGLAPPEISKRFIDNIPGFETNGYKMEKQWEPNSNFLLKFNITNKRNWKVSSCINESVRLRLSQFGRKY